MIQYIWFQHQKTLPYVFPKVFEQLNHTPPPNILRGITKISSSSKIISLWAISHLLETCSDRLRQRTISLDLFITPFISLRGQPLPFSVSNSYILCRIINTVSQSSASTRRSVLVGTFVSWVIHLELLKGDILYLDLTPCSVRCWLTQSWLIHPD